MGTYIPTPQLLRNNLQEGKFKRCPFFDKKTWMLDVAFCITGDHYALFHAAAV